VVRFVTAIPLLIALAWGAVRVVAVAYRELTVPSDVAVPVAIRIVTSAPDAVAAIILTWLFAEALGGLAARRIALLAAGVPEALRGALGRFFRHPFRCVVLTILPTAVLGILLGAVAWAAGVALDQVRATFDLDPGAPFPLLTVLVFVTLFLGGLVLLAVITAWRSAIWTVDLAGTFGGVHNGRPGDWNPVTDSGTLGGLRPQEPDPDPDTRYE
jgi:hypothetical protein